MRTQSETPVLRAIHSERDLAWAHAEIDRLIDAKPGTPDYARLEVLGILVNVYELEHHRLPPPDPVEAIRFRMEQGGLQQKDLAALFGSRPRASEVLSRKRPLTLEMIRALHTRWGIPLQSLVDVQPPRQASEFPAE